MGHKRYELTNHLGNVMATMTDRRLQAVTHDSVVTAFDAEVVNAQDYNSFGSIMEGRQLSTADSALYRYGFNGKENDNDVGKGTGGEQDYGARIYDPRIGRFLSIDPIMSSYPQLTPYQFAGNSPIQAVDLDGEEPKSVVNFDDNTRIGKFTEPAIHLLHIVSNVDESLIGSTYVVERSKGSFVPAYDPNEGGGAITLPFMGKKAIIYTPNYFENDPMKFDNNGLGMDIDAWFDQSSHEVGHLPQIVQQKTLINYIGSFIKQYTKSGNHDAAPYEVQADKGRIAYEAFRSFTNQYFGKNAISNLFKGNQSDKDKDQTLDNWYKAFQSYQELKSSKGKGKITINDIINNLSNDEKNKK